MCDGGRIGAREPCRAVVVVNPAAGGGARPQALRQAIGVLAERGWIVSVAGTQWPGHAEELAATAAADGVDVVVAAGGDGTVHEVANGIVGSRTALAVLPCGTGNVAAAQLGLIGVPTPLHRGNLPLAAELLARGTVRDVDVGRAVPRGRDGRCFLMWAGIGLDAAVAHELESTGRELKRLLGPAAFGALGLRTALGGAGTPAQVRCDDRRLRGPLVVGVAANAPLYAGSVNLPPVGLMDDGMLDVNLIFAERMRDAVPQVGALLAGLPADDRGRVAIVSRRVRVVSCQPLPVHLDAEPFGTTPVTIGVWHRALRLLVPPSAPEGLFAAAGPASSPDAGLGA